MRYIVGFLLGVLLMAALSFLEDMCATRTPKTPARTAPSTRRISL